MNANVALRFVNAQLIGDAPLMAALGTPTAPYAVHDTTVVDETATAPWIVLFPESGVSQDALREEGGWDPTLYVASVQVKVQVVEMNVTLLETLVDRVMAVLGSVWGTVGTRSVQSLFVRDVPRWLDTSDNQRRLTWIGWFEVQVEAAPAA